MKKFRFKNIFKSEPVGGIVPRPASELESCGNGHGGAVPAAREDSRKRKAIGGIVPSPARAFTLAEILITLGIVGVVAVLTIPSVMKNYKNRMYTAQLEKVYSQITNAASAIMTEEQVDSFYETKAASASSKDDSGKYIAGVPYFFNNYFKTIKQDCRDSSEPCAKSGTGTYKTISGASVTGFGASNYCIQTTNGATICGFYNPNNTCMSVAVDVNGLESPNIVGRDVFSMDIHKDGTIVEYNSGCGLNSVSCPSSMCSKGGTGSPYTASCGCLSSIIESGWKMEY